MTASPAVTRRAARIHRPRACRLCVNQLRNVLIGGEWVLRDSVRDRYGRDMCPRCGLVWDNDIKRTCYPMRTYVDYASANRAVLPVRRWERWLPLLQAMDP